MLGGGGVTVETTEEGAAEEVELRSIVPMTCLVGFLLDRLKGKSLFSRAKGLNMIKPLSKCKKDGKEEEERILKTMDGLERQKKLRLASRTWASLKGPKMEPLLGIDTVCQVGTYQVVWTLLGTVYYGGMLYPCEDWG